MLINHSQNKTSMKKVKLDGANENGSSNAEYKRLAFLKFYNENGKRSFKFNKLFTTDDVHEIGIYCWFKLIW